MTRRICIIAGEKSGDIIGENIIKSLTEMLGDVEYYGIGGELMVKAGLQELECHNSLAVMGITDVIRKYFHIKKILENTVDKIRTLKPDLVITIDSQEFSKHLAKRILDMNVPKVHIVAPTVWAWRSGRVHTYKKIFDRILCLFPFEPKYFTEVGMDAHFVGHPTGDMKQGCGCLL